MPKPTSKAIVMELPTRLTFAWWNLNDFAHYDADRWARKASIRWPAQQTDYVTKRDLILATLRKAFQGDYPDLLALCEITREAVSDLVSELPSGFDVAVAPSIRHEDDFQVAVIYKTGIGFTAEFPLIPSRTEDVTRETRPMIVVHFKRPGHLIRFVACHWTGMDKRTSQTMRDRLADFLRRDTFGFLRLQAPKSNFSRHVVILGDLNEEPMSEIIKSKLGGQRDRKSCLLPHWRDGETKRIRLYNLSWRFLGEQHPHGSGRSLMSGPAGTCYTEKKGWLTLDHVLVSGGLLGKKPPLIDEEHTKVISLPKLRDNHGRPKPFDSIKKQGVSDHFPIVGQIILPENSR